MDVQFAPTKAFHIVLPPVSSCRDTYIYIVICTPSVRYLKPHVKLNHRTPKLEAQSTLGTERPLL